MDNEFNFESIIKDIYEREKQAINEENNPNREIPDFYKKMNAWEETQLYTSITIEELLKKIRNGEISGRLCIGRTFIPGDNTIGFGEIYCANKQFVLYYTDHDHPITIPNDSTNGNPQISIEYYQKYKNEIKKAYFDYFSNSNEINYDIYNYNFSDEILAVLLKKKDSTLYFINVNLSEQQLNQIQNTFIDVYINGKKINSRYVISFYTLDNIKSNNSFMIDSSDIKKCNSNIFNYFNDNSIISINNYEKKDEEEYIEAAFSLLEKVDKLDKKLCFKISIKIRSILEKYINKYNFKNIDLHIINDFYEYSYQEYMEEEELLNSLVEPIKNSDLSPFEKYIAVYNIVKNFKPYKENENNREQARYLRHILHNDYIVCVGYAKLLHCLLEKVGIKSNEIGVEVDTSYDDGFNPNNPTEQTVKRGGHARLVINMEDDKYNIHGLYMADPTWDNNLEKDYLNHALMTFDNVITARRMFFFSFTNPILTFHSFQEFSRQVNYLLKSEINKRSSNNQKQNITKIILESYKDIATAIIDNIECDERIIYFKDLLKNCHDEDDYTNFFTELGHYLLIRINKPIDSELIMQANDVVRKKINNLDVNNAREDSDERELRQFPYQIPDDESHEIKAR